MRLVLHDGVSGEVEDSPQSVSDPGRGRYIVRRLVPDRQDVLLTDRWRETDRCSHGLGLLCVGIHREKVVPIGSS